MGTPRGTQHVFMGYLQCYYAVFLMSSTVYDNSLGIVVVMDIYLVLILKNIQTDKYIFIAIVNQYTPNSFLYT